MDALAVAIAAGLVIPRLTYRHIFRLSFHFGLFQFLMPVTGWLAGRTIEGYIRPYDHWLVFGILAAVGLKMLWESRIHRDSENRDDPTRGWLLVGLSIATSLDALAVGLSLAFLKVSIWTPSLVIGIVAAALTLLGICFGNRIGRRFGKLAEAFGGVVLIAIAVHVLAAH